MRLGNAVKAPGFKVSKRRRSDIAWGYLFILPQLIGVLVFVLFPVGFAFTLSFMEWDGLGEKSFAGFSNFIAEFKSADLRIALTNTVYYTALVVPGGVSLALLAALGLNKVRGKTIYRALYFAPVVTSTVAVAIIWLWVLNKDFGLINSYLESWFGVQGPNWLVDKKYVIPSISMLSIWQGLGFNMVIFLAGLQSIPATYSEAAQIDGANKWQIFWRVTLPLLSPTTFFVIIISVINSFQVFDQAFVMTQGGPDKASYTMVYHLYELAFVDFTFGKSAAAAVILFVMILTLTLFQLRVQRRWVHYEE